MGLLPTLNPGLGASQPHGLLLLVQALRCRLEEAISPLLRFLLPPQRHWFPLADARAGLCAVGQLHCLISWLISCFCSWLQHKTHLRTPLSPMAGSVAKTHSRTTAGFGVKHPQWRGCCDCGRGCTSPTLCTRWGNLCSWHWPNHGWDTDTLISPSSKQIWPCCWSLCAELFLPAPCISLECHPGWIVLQRAIWNSI